MTKSETKTIKNILENDERIAGYLIKRNENKVICSIGFFYNVTFNFETISKLVIEINNFIKMTY